MPGAGKTRKEYYINFNYEDVAFGVEPVSPTTQVSISGELQDAPGFSPKNDPIKTKRHSELGANSNVLKGKFSGSLSLNETVKDFRPVSRLFGTSRLISMTGGSIIGLAITGGTNIQTEDAVTDGTAAGLIEAVTFAIDGITGGTGDYVVGEVCTIDASGAAVVEAFQLDAGGLTGTITLSNVAVNLIDDSAIVGASGATTSAAKLKVADTISIWQTPFIAGETVTFVGSGATATLHNIINNVASITILTGTVVGTDLMTGDDSGATAAVLSAAVQTAPTFDQFTISSAITIGTATPLTFTASTQTLKHRHQLTVAPDQDSYAVNYGYVSLANQHLMTGSVIKSVAIDSASGEAPKQAEEWLFADAVIDDTLDPEKENTSELYRYTDIDDTLNEVSYSHVLRTTSMTLTRSNLAPIDSHQKLTPTGFKGAELESKLSFEIHREDKTILNLRTNDTAAPLNLTWAKAGGYPGDVDTGIFVFTVKMLEPEEAGEETILLTVPTEVIGKPTVTLFNDFQNMR